MLTTAAAHKKEGIQSRLWQFVDAMAGDGPLRDRLDLAMHQLIVLHHERERFPRFVHKDLEQCVVRARSLKSVTDEEVRAIAKQALHVVHAVLLDLYDDDE